MVFKKDKVFNLNILKGVYVYIIILICIINLNSCISTVKTTDSNGVKFSELYRMSKETQGEVFVITADGVKHSGTKLKFSPTHFTTKVYIQIDDIKYPNKKADKVIAYQTENLYTVYYPSYDVPSIRVVKGKINLYRYFTTKPVNYADGRVGADLILHFCLEKEKGKFLDGSFSNLEILFGDNSEVIQKFHELYPDDVRKKGLYPKLNTFKAEDAHYDNMIMLVQMYNK